MALEWQLGQEYCKHRKDDPVAFRIIRNVMTVFLFHSFSKIQFFLSVSIPLRHATQCLHSQEIACCNSSLRQPARSITCKINASLPSWQRND